VHVCIGADGVCDYERPIQFVVNDDTLAWAIVHKTQIATLVAYCGLIVKNLFNPIFHDVFVINGCRD
jgi:hypothetical protein